LRVTFVLVQRSAAFSHRCVTTRNNEGATRGPEIVILSTNVSYEMIPLLLYFTVICHLLCHHYASHLGTNANVGMFVGFRVVARKLTPPSADSVFALIFEAGIVIIIQLTHCSCF